MLFVVRLNLALVDRLSCTRVTNPPLPHLQIPPHTCTPVSHWPPHLVNHGPSGPLTWISMSSPAPDSGPLETKPSVLKKKAHVSTSMHWGLWPPTLLFVRSKWVSRYKSKLFFYHHYHYMLYDILHDIYIYVIFMSYIIWYTIYFAILLHVPLEQPPLSCMLLQHNNCCVIWHILFSTLWSCFTLVALPFHALYILNKVVSVTASCGVSINECNNEGVHLPEIGDKSARIIAGKDIYQGTYSNPFKSVSH